MITQPKETPNWRDSDSGMEIPDLIIAAEYGDLARVKAAIAAGVSVNTQESRAGVTALHAAAARGHKNIVIFLLSVDGIEPHIHDNFGKTPFDLANESAHREIADIIYRVIKEGIKDDGNNVLEFPSPE